LTEKDEKWHDIGRKENENTKYIFDERFREEKNQIARYWNTPHFLLLHERQRTRKNPTKYGEMYKSKKSSAKPRKGRIYFF